MEEMRARPGWKQVPMPPAVASLPRDSRGYPVGWTTLWEPRDAPGRSSVIRSPEEGAVLWCYCATGTGTPLLGQMCPRRQRTAMARRRCQLCGTSIDRDAKVVFIAGESEGTAAQLVREPPLHAACAAYAARVCPYLVVGNRAGALRVAEAASYQLFEERVRPDSLDPQADMLREVFPLGSRAALRFGALENLLAAPAGTWVPFATWFAGLPPSSSQG
ncbi:hypothetical protein OG393_32965 (plasmid) [Streptomyces sp. NBC_01216]|uniref:hypothetical protein n=1 Tax=Streptomyces sp. NBC_01216 TaxID=2903778 RepID=UPI002E104916|nr:hypothetical protein OG393_32965 [Streptomyces sp. NBC_01216]